MANFTVKWSTKIFDADSPLESAENARYGIVSGIAQVFLVKNEETNECFSIDLCEEDDSKVLPLSLEEFNNS